mgnify:CR=1 FL=1
MSAVVVPIRSHSDIVSISGVHVLRGVLTPRECAMLCAHSGARAHHQDDGHGLSAKKNVRLPLVSLKILGKIDAGAVAPYRPLNIDEMMKVYRLDAGLGAVAEHTDADFIGPDGSIAKFSVLVYLNGQYAGGETLFRGINPKADLAPGDAYLFRHDIPHEGMPVRLGTKFVLKTDLFVES